MIKSVAVVILHARANMMLLMTMATMVMVKIAR